MLEMIEAVSLVLTAPLLALAGMVVYYWFPDSLNASKKPISIWQSHDWFVVGIAISFIGSILDNAYWGLAWSTALIHHDCRDCLFEWGALPNIFFRQIATSVAAYCHLRAAAVYLGNRRQYEVLKWTKFLNLVTVLSVVAGLMYVTVLWILT